MMGTEICRLSFNTLVLLFLTFTFPYPVNLMQPQDNAHFNFEKKRNDSRIQCSSYHRMSNESNVCKYVTEFPACIFNDGYLQYIKFPYCCFKSHLRALGFIILFLWLMYLFIALGVTAEEFFCPCLKSISKTLKMSDSVAGVTLLALGNGAPDIFSVIAAVNNDDPATTSLAFQELFGAGIFVTTVVSGCVHISASFKLARRPFMRDCIFYCAAVGWTITVMYKKDIKTAEAIGFIVLYCLYALIVIVGQFVNRRLRLQEGRSRLLTVSCGADDDHSEQHCRHIIEDLNESADFASYNYSNDNAHMFKENVHAPSRRFGNRLEQYEAIINEDITESIDLQIQEISSTLLERLIGIKKIDWNFKSLLSKVFSLIQIPIMVTMNVTCPVVDKDVQGEKWNKVLVCFQCLISPIFCAFAVNQAFAVIYKAFVVWHLLLIVGVLLMLIALYCTSKDTVPRYHFVLAILGFVVAIIWIKAIAQEIVNLLQTFGWTFGLTYGIMGLTFLAWGNSVGDFISNLTMARHGAPRMAIAACYGGPLLNMLLGIGISCTISALSNKGEKKLIRGTTQYILSALFLATSLLSVLTILPLLRFRSSKYIGVYLLLLYSSYLVLSVLHETDVFHVKIH